MTTINSTAALPAQPATFATINAATLPVPLGYRHVAGEYRHFYRLLTAQGFPAALAHDQQRLAGLFEHFTREALSVAREGQAEQLNQLRDRCAEGDALPQFVLLWTEYCFQQRSALSSFDPWELEAATQRYEERSRLRNRNRMP